MLMRLYATFISTSAATVVTGALTKASHHPKFPTGVRFAGSDFATAAVFNAWKSQREVFESKLTRVPTPKALAAYSLAVVIETTPRGHPIAIASALALRTILADYHSGKDAHLYREIDKELFVKAFAAEVLYREL